MTHNDVACAGKHIVIDFWGAEHLQDVKVIEQALTYAAEVAGAVLLHIHLHKFSGAGGVYGCCAIGRITY